MITLAVEVPLPPPEAADLLRRELQDAGIGGVEVRAEPLADGTRLTVEHRGLEDDAAEVMAWFARELVGRTTDDALDDWITDRRARRPTGARARDVYADPLYHRPNFHLLLETLALGPDDELLEVGCGGGALLHQALRSGCRGAAVDHSPEMVALAREQNADTVAAGRLEIVQADAHRLPFGDGRFTAVVSTGVFGFIGEPLRALTEIHRVLRREGRLAIFGGTKELRGTPAAPEPIASRITWYDDEELAQLARQAGFRTAEVTRPSLARHARAAGIPEEHLPLFEGPSFAQLLVAHK